MIEEADPPIAKSTDDARAGVTGHNVRYVLGFGLVGVIAAFLIAYFTVIGPR